MVAVKCVNMNGKNFLIEKKFEELNTAAELTTISKDITKLLKNIKEHPRRMYDQILKLKKDGEYEKAYVICKRYLNIVKTLKAEESSLDAEVIALIKKYVRPVIDNRNKLRLLIEEQLIENIEDNYSDISFVTPEPNEQNLNSFDGEISCERLLKLCHQNDKVMIIDIREKDDFEKNTILLSNVINIPTKRIISEDYTQKEFEKTWRSSKYADKDSIHPWMEYIVLVDWDSSTKDVHDDPLVKLQTSLINWNVGVHIPDILIGGFNAWKKEYPNYIGIPECCSMNIHVDVKKLSIDSGGFKERNDASNKIDSNNSYNNNYSNNHREDTLLPLSALDIFAIVNSKQEPVVDDDNDSDIEPIYDIETCKKVAAKRNLAENHKIISKKNIQDRKLSHKEPKVIVTKVNPPPVNRSTKPNIPVQNTRKNIIVNTNSNDEWEKEQAEGIAKQQNLYPEMKSFYKDVEKLFNSQTKSNKENDNIYPSPNLSAKMDIDEEESDCQSPSNGLPITPLKRSHSSPNIAQVKKPKINHEESKRKNIPEPDRSTKPVLQDKAINESRQSELEPVYISGRPRPGITGLKNLGNSCYMNSIIQCLSNTPDLADYFQINSLNINKSNGKKHYVADEVAYVIKNLWRGNFKSISPRKLKFIIGEYKWQFQGSYQQDSHEFLTYLLEWIHNDLKKKPIKNSDEEKLHEAQKQWIKNMGNKYSIISQLFYGQQKSTIRCRECNNSSVTYETFNTLTISLPSSGSTLEECLRKYTSDQPISDWNCTTCNVPRTAYKKFDFVRLPSITVIHLNRFGDSGGFLKKNSTAIEFPLRNLNFSISSDNLAASGNGKSKWNYNLYAISNHYGTMEGGHYTAYCKNESQAKWFKFDDHTVTEVSESQVKNQSNNAYLLFYKTT